MRVAKLLLLCLISAVTSQAHGTTWLWAWDRAEDLRGLPPAIGVAYFAVQFDADGQSFAPTWRRPPLRVDATTPLTAVFHIEAFRPGHPPMLGDAAVGRRSDAMADAAHRIGAKRVHRGAGELQQLHDQIATKTHSMPPSVSTERIRVNASVRS